MKRNFLCFAAALALLLSGCSSGGPTPAEAFSAPLPRASPSLPAPAAPKESAASESPPRATLVTLPKSISRMVNGVTIMVDPMLELLSIVQYLSDYDEQSGMMTHVKTAYCNDVDLAFGSFKGHDAVGFMNDAMKNGFAFEKPPSACLYLEKDFSISADYAPSSFAENLMTADMNRFRDVMEQFCIDTSFAQFFEAHSAFYGEMLKQYTDAFPEWDMIQAMDTYYGKSMAEHTVVLVPLFFPVGYGHGLSRADGLHVYSMLGPVKSDGDIPLFGSEATIIDMVIHEFGHSFLPINAFDDAAMAEEVARSRYLMEPIRQQMESLDYKQWNTVYEELVLRAAVIDITVRSTGVSPKQALQAERNQGFLYIDDVYEVLQVYSESRGKYPTFDLFVPVITDCLLERYPQKNVEI